MARLRLVLAAALAALVAQAGQPRLGRNRAEDPAEVGMVLDKFFDLRV